MKDSLCKKLIVKKWLGLRYLTNVYLTFKSVFMYVGDYC